MSDTNIAQAKTALDIHLREIIRWHFSPETGTPIWLEWAEENNMDAVKEIQTTEDLLKFGNFDEAWLRFKPHEEWIPKDYIGKAYSVFETGGTTGMPKQRIGWEDYKIDYSQFSELLDDKDFPSGGNWLMMGPTGPRRLRLAIEHLANVRGSSCYFVDLDPRWVKKLIARKAFHEAKLYMEHVIDQALVILKHRKVTGLFTTPKLLESLAEKISIPGVGIKGVFCGGTQMPPQTVRFLIEEVLENRVKLIPTYGNTLMGLAAHKPLSADDNYSITYYAPQPRAILRVVDTTNPEKGVDYGQWGRVELTTLTKELFMPRFLERDEAIRRKPCGQFAWDGVGDVRPFGAGESKVIEGVY
ncbi:MAG TPA: hypothetical protein EYQ50_02590 [Verrucomicrobiales bacterium]|nr:hypothetical protein [Verrucomicrobiales bacterium]